MPVTPQEPADDTDARWKSTIPVAHGMGVRVTELGPGSATTTVPLAGNANHVGTMYAGVLFTVAELLGGVIATSSFDTTLYYPVVKDLAIRFRRPAMTDVMARAALDQATITAVTAEAAASGKADFRLTAEVTDVDGVVVATTQGTYQIRRR